MTSDFPADLGPAEPGLEQLLAALTCGPTADELAGEQAALAMFRANIHPPVPAPAASATAILPVPRPTRRPRAPGLRRWRLAAAGTTVALVGGFAAAAYAAVLPAPVQHVAYQAFGVFGVPDTRHNGAAGTHQRQSSSSHPGSHRGGPGASHSAAGSPAPSPSATAGSSGNPGNPPAPTGSATMTAAAAASQVPAGDSVTIDGQLTRASKAVSGVTVRLWERPAGHLSWQFAGQATTGAEGTVAITTAGLTTNATFRLTDPDGPVSPPVIVTVVPQITAQLTPGPRGVKDYLTVATVDAQRGDTVVLQIDSNGTWVGLRDRRLNAAGRTAFVLGARQLKGDAVQVVLLGTGRHAAAVSNQVIVPAPT
jgi:hypothetical protein